MAINATIYFLASPFRVSIGTLSLALLSGFACVVLYIAGFVMLFGFSRTKIPFPESFKPHAAFTTSIHDRQIQ
jgi:hypothetical protein